MVVYYIYKASENLADYRYPIKEGDICMLYDGEVIKTVYIDSELDSDSIWRDFKFLDTKSLKGYQFPTSDSILCAPVGDKHVIGDTRLLTLLIKECKGEWLLDFLNETSAVLSGFVDYWDLGVLRRFIGVEDIEIIYENDETLTDLFQKSEEHDDVNEYDEEEDVDNTDFLSPSYDIKRFCLSALSCIEGHLDERNYHILYDTLSGDTRSEIAHKYHLTQERIRQIVVKAIKQASELLIEQRKSIEEMKAGSVQMNAQLNLLKDDIANLKARLPRETIISLVSENEEIDSELAALLETPVSKIELPIRAAKVLINLGVKKFADIPQIDSSLQLLKERNSGKKTVYEVLQFLEDFNLTFGMSYTEIVNALSVNHWQDTKRKWIKEEYYKQKDSNPTEDVIKDNVSIERSTINIANHTQGNLNVEDNVKGPHVRVPEINIVLNENDFTVKNTLLSCIILNKFGEMVFSTEGKLKYIGKKLYRFNLKDECFTIKDMQYKEGIWMKGSTKIVALPGSKLYSVIDNAIDYITQIEDIEDRPIFEECKLKVNGSWFGYDGTFLKPEQKAVGSIKIDNNVDEIDDFYSQFSVKLGDTLQLFPSQHIGKVVDLILDKDGQKKIVVRSKEGSIVSVYDNKYFYKKIKIEKKESPTIRNIAQTKRVDVSSTPKRRRKAYIGNWIKWKPTGDIGKVVAFKTVGRITKLILQLKGGSELEVFDNPQAYDIIAQ